jgi:hypothetical protein
MGQIERDSDCGAAFGAEPFVAEIANRFECYIFGGFRRNFRCAIRARTGDIELEIAMRMRKSSSSVRSARFGADFSVAEISCRDASTRLF